MIIYMYAQVYRKIGRPRKQSSTQIRSFFQLIHWYNVADYGGAGYGSGTPLIHVEYLFNKLA